MVVDDENGGHGATAPRAVELTAASALSASGQLSTLRAVLQTAAKLYLGARLRRKRQPGGGRALGEPNNSDLWGPDRPPVYQELTATRK